MTLQTPSAPAQPPNSWNFSIPENWINKASETFNECQKSLMPMMQTAGKVALSTVYLGLGLSLIGAGAYTTVYTLHKSHQFYFYDRTNQPWHITRWWYNLAPGPDNLGYGPGFKKGCDSFLNWANAASGPAVCPDLANHGWKEINRAESTAAAVALTIFVGGSALFLSSYAIIGGISLLGRSFQTFMSAVNDYQKSSKKGF